LRLGRGTVWYVDWPEVGDRPVAVISPEYMNVALRSAIVIRVTSAQKRRALPTFVRITPGEISALDRESFVICNDVATLPEGVFRRKLGELPAARLVEIESALRRATGLD
jgi:mRNA-degrading endonuclease toxin of MazEF toxin-antitoxin module